MSFKLSSLFLFLALFSCANSPSDSNNIIEYREPTIGEAIDEHNDVKIYYNGDVLKSHGRTIIDDYNCGKKYQCVEFVKRYYYLKLKHRMTNVWGHASQYFNMKLPDGAFNRDKGLIQFTNPSKSKPRIDDILIWGGKYGHVAIVSKVKDNKIEIVQQNVGTATRIEIDLVLKDEMYFIADGSIAGWLRMK